MKIAIISLGCPKNQVDADVFCHALIKDGHTTVADPAEADIIIINTCGFIESAKTEAIENILMACQYKQENPDLKVIVTGCLAERYKQQIIQEIPEVDAVLGIGSNAALPAIVRRLCDDAVLKAMNRRGGRKEIEDAIARLRAAIPGITLRTTLIAGFPGETEEQYAELCDFVKSVRFDRLGCFAYSAEENTVAAKMPNQIDEETKQRRADHIMELQAEVSAEREGEKVGHTYECICDGVDDETGMYLLRTKADCPEIDGSVLTPADTPLETGAFYKVTITDSDTYDLYGYAEERLED